MCKDDQHQANAAIGEGARLAFGSMRDTAGAPAIEHRLEGREALLNRARLLREQADGYEALARSIPEEISPAADRWLTRMAYGMP